MTRTAKMLGAALLIASLTGAASAADEPKQGAPATTAVKAETKKAQKQAADQGKPTSKAGKKKKDGGC